MKEFTSQKPVSLIKYILFLLPCLLILFSCSGMPLQGLSTANYAYKPPHTTTNESITIHRSNTQPYRQRWNNRQPYRQRWNNRQPYRQRWNNRQTIRRSTRSSSYPENAFKSLRESAYNIERTSDSLEDIVENLEKIF